MNCKYIHGMITHSTLSSDLFYRPLTRGSRKDATLRELVELIQCEVEETKPRTVRLSLSLVHPDRSGRSV